jgi:hypothetical protein
MNIVKPPVNDQELQRWRDFVTEHVKPMWVDMQWDIASGKVSAANYPDWETFTTNTSAYGFATDDFIDLKAEEVPHGWQEGSDISVHLHIALKAANATGSNRFAKFTVYLAYAGANAAWAEITPLTRLVLRSKPASSVLPRLAGRNTRGTSLSRKLVGMCCVMQTAAET